jgi:hypothetical protein
MKASPKGVSWGTTNIPKKKWIDLNKTYQTRSGKRILGLHIKLTNSLDNEVTFPVKGSVDMGRNKRPKYMIWTLDGRADLFQDTDLDLKVEKA